MPRPKKYRHIYVLPRCSSFGPLEGTTDSQMEMAVEEYEVIRLIDLLGYTQEECVAQIGVARSTMQQVHSTTRRRLAQALMEGRRLHISDGDYVLCPRGEEYPSRDCTRWNCGMGRCGCGACLRSKKD